MGLDWIPENKAKPGYEEEFDRLLDIKRSGSPDSWDNVSDRFEEISITPYETLGAPQVGRDKEADDWLWNMHQDGRLNIPWEGALEEMAGYWVYQLIPPCDGKPKFTHAGLYGMDDLTFRGQFLKQCESVPGYEIVEQGWNHMSDVELLDYGKKLLEIARSFAAEQGIDIATVSGDRPEIEDETALQLEILVAAGKWCVFYGERGHGLYADF